MSSEYRICSRCILDTNDDPQIAFDVAGVCNYCREYDQTLRKFIMLDPDEREARLKEQVDKIKLEGKGKQYDSIVGVSGGVDSTYLAYQAKRLGLRPLVVHYDNGWNSEMAVQNIENIVRKLDLDLYTYVNDWEEFKDLQLSFFKASVIDIELITDQAIVAILYDLAAKYGVKTILYGSNIVTEGILPRNWYHWKTDVLNITGIHKQFGKQKIRTYPMLTFFKNYYYTRVLKIKSVSLLNYMPYVKEEAKRTITQELGWRDYGGKHYESIFTRFYQGYILPRKFGVDKRKAHLSTLICSGQIGREVALHEIQKATYDPQKQQEDKEYVVKKLGLTDSEFEEIMRLPIKQHLDYPSYFKSHYKYQEKLSKLIKPVKRMLGFNRPFTAPGELKVLHIPAWYPTRYDTHRALFIREHINALGLYCHNHVIHIEARDSDKHLLRFERFKEAGNEEVFLCHTKLRKLAFKELIAFLMLFYELVIKRKARHYDIINLYIAYPFGLYLNTLRFFTRKPMVITEHWSAYHYNFSVSPDTRGLRKIKNIFRKKAHFITVSEALARDIITFSNTTPKFSIIPNVVDTHTFYRDHTELSKTPVFLTINIWSSIKNPFIVIDGFEKFLEKHRDGKLRIGGYGPLWNDMVEYVRKKGLEGHIDLLGKLDKNVIARELNSSTALLHSSDYETFSVICAEALSCGTPVIASNVGAIPSLIDKSNGILIGEETAEKWAEAMEAVFVNQSRYHREEIADAAHLKYSAENVGRAYFETLKMVKGSAA